MRSGSWRTGSVATPVQHALLAQLFPCNKAILGDVNQSLNAGPATDAEAIARVFGQAECVKLNKSYRSSYEITGFAQAISPNADLEAIERRAHKPRVASCRDEREEWARVQQAVAMFPGRGWLSDHGNHLQDCATGGTFVRAAS